MLTEKHTFLCHGYLAKISFITRISLIKKMERKRVMINSVVLNKNNESLVVHLKFIEYIINQIQMNHSG
ncbi:hypothetical protein Xekk_03661 [Xenorhabdus sp. KK7.4]|nr:hypothetical protein Xekk_03661 [Xenorhabdus sp. KK7.4]